MRMLCIFFSFIHVFIFQQCVRTVPQVSLHISMNWFGSGLMFCWLAVDILIQFCVFKHTGVFPLNE